MKSFFEFQKVLCFHKDGFLALHPEDGLASTVIQIVFNDIPQHGFYVTCFNSYVKFQHGQILLNKYRYGIGCCAGLRGEGATKGLIGDDFNVSINDPQLRYKIILDPELYYCFDKNPIYFPGKLIYVDYNFSVADYTALAMVNISYSFFIGIGYNVI